MPPYETSDGPEEIEQVGGTYGQAESTIVEARCDTAPRLVQEQ